MKNLAISLLLSTLVVAGASALTAQLDEDVLNNNNNDDTALTADANLDADLADADENLDLDTPDQSDSFVTGEYSNRPLGGSFVTGEYSNRPLEAGPFQEMQDEEYGATGLEDLNDDEIDLEEDETTASADVELENEDDLDQDASDTL